MLDKYKENQKLFYDYITKSFANNNLSHAYLIQANNVSYAFDLALDFVKYLFCENSYNEKICSLIDNNTFSNFILIDCEKTINKELILNLQKDFSLKTINKGEKKVYLIKDASLLNDASANSLLKFLEEPEDDVIAILLVNNIDEVKETIKSRCQIINLINDSFDYKNLFDYCEFTSNESDKIIENEYKEFLKFYVILEKNSALVLKDKEVYNLCEKIKPLLKFGIYLYFDLINVILGRNCNYFLPQSEEKKQILKNNSVDSVVQKIKLIDKFLAFYKHNVNVNLFFDNFVVKFGGE